jgi:CRP-like cAMP-binding protein
VPKPTDPHSEHDRLIRKLESIAELSAEEKSAVRSLPLVLKNLPGDTDIVRDGDRPSECCLVIEGFACRYKITPAGKRQIMSFHIPGDIPDLQSLHLRVMDHGIGTLNPCRLAFIPHESLRGLMRRHPRIADAFWRDTLIDAAVFREWMVGIGRRSAYQRIAHLLCEMLVRCRAVGLTHDYAYELPANAGGTRGRPRAFCRACEPRAPRVEGRRPDRAARPVRQHPRLGGPQGGRRVRPDLSAPRPGRGRGVTLTLQSVRVDTGSEDEDGLLVFADGRLVAVLVRLSDEHGDKAGRWFLEHGFGRLDGTTHPIFDDIETAQAWIAGRI